MPIAPDDTRLIAYLDQALGAAPPAALGLAVSGGGDSMALLSLAKMWAEPHECRLEVATVNHGLRAGAAAEARLVAETCAGFGLGHTTLHWTSWDGTGNLQDTARRARYALLAGWARQHGLTRIALGHTQDDNAETLVMGLARGTGLDGLTGMRPCFRRDGITFVRPLLDASRADLRAHLDRQGMTWVENPSNEDARFERVRVRNTLAELADLGIDPTQIASTIAHLRDTQAAIAHHLADWANRHTTQDRGDLLVDPGAFGDLPTDFARRLLAAALRWISGADHPPRGDSLGQLLGASRAKGQHTLMGCLLSFRRGEMRLSREPEAARRARPAASGTIWDTRWLLKGPATPKTEIRALTTDGLKTCPDWRATNLPRATLAASPALWQGEALVAAPLAGLDNGWRAELSSGRDDFAASLISR